MQLRTGFFKLCIRITHVKDVRREGKSVSHLTSECSKLAQREYRKRAKEAKIIDIAILGDVRLKDKELEKIEKSQFLEKRNRKVVEGEVKVVPVVIEALGAVSHMFEKLNVGIRLKVIENAALFGTA